MILLGAGCKSVEGAGGAAAAGSGGAGGRRAVAAAPPAHAVPARLLHIQSPSTVSWVFYPADLHDSHIVQLPTVHLCLTALSGLHVPPVLLIHQPLCLSPCLTCKPSLQCSGQAQAEQ